MIKVAANAKEVTFSADELIISKTDLKGDISYANRHFMRVSNFPESKLIGQPHSIMRHPDMPRGVYHAMWKSLKAKKEFFGFVKNLTADGHYYWVFANVTPDFVQGNIQGFFSVRRKPSLSAITTMTDVYNQMRSIEAQSSTAEAPKKSWQWLESFLQEQHGSTYESFVLKLYSENK